MDCQEKVTANTSDASIVPENMQSHPALSFIDLIQMKGSNVAEKRTILQFDLHTSQALYNTMFC